MKFKIINYFLVLCVIISIFTIPTSALENTFVELDNPSDVFWGDFGIWEYEEEGKVFSGRQESANQLILNFTDFGVYESQEMAISQMGDYRVNLDINRPSRYSPEITRFVIGAKEVKRTTAFPEGIRIDFAGAGMQITQFGVVLKAISWSAMDSSISFGDKFSLEIIVGEAVEIKVNGNTCYTYQTLSDEAFGLFAIGGDSLKLDSKIQFSNIRFYNSDFVPQVEVTKVNAYVTKTQEDGLNLKLENLSAGDAFQVWSKAKMQVDSSDIGNENTLANYWTLTKEFTDAENVISLNETTHQITIPEASEIFVRVKSNSGEYLLQEIIVQEDFVEETPEVKEQETKDLIIDEQETSYSKFANDNAFNIPILTAGDTLTFDLNDSIHELNEDDFFKYTIGERWKSTIFSIGYTKDSNFAGEINSPGIYAIRGFVSNGAKNSYDDGLDRNFKVIRESKGQILGEAKIQDIEVLFDGEEENNPLPNQLISIKAIAGGLYGEGVLENGEDYLFAFYRLDCDGYRLVKDYSEDSNLYFRPVAPGHYTIQVRVRGKDAGSFEDIRSLSIVVDGYEKIKEIDFLIGQGEETFTEREQIELFAILENADDYLYRFDVWDEYLGSMCIQSFSPDTNPTWTPRKAGRYKITLRAQSKTSLGFGDILVSKEVLVDEIK